MTKVGIFLGGEGSNELGSRSGDPIYQNSTVLGVVETLLRVVQPDGWEVTGATRWSKIRKLSATRPTPNEERNVLGLVYEAKRAHSQVVAFVRDADDDTERAKAIDEAVIKALEDSRAGQAGEVHRAQGHGGHGEGCRRDGP
jgi:hypothetical protein